MRNEQRNSYLVGGGPRLGGRVEEGVSSPWTDGSSPRAQLPVYCTFSPALPSLRESRPGTLFYTLKGLDLPICFLYSRGRTSGERVGDSPASGIDQKSRISVLT